ncbi:hypothetical protein D3C87_1872610 [compost metagenome]
MCANVARIIVNRITSQAGGLPTRLSIPIARSASRAAVPVLISASPMTSVPARNSSRFHSTVFNALRNGIPETLSEAMTRAPIKATKGKATP